MNHEIQKRESGELENVHSETAMVVKGETISSVLAAQAKAEVEARYIVAMQRPRNTELVRSKLMAECKRKGFALSAFYDLTKQSKGSGFSIRFAEAAMRLMGNMDCRVTTTFDDEEKRILRIDVIDIENNSSISMNEVVMKQVERKKLKQGEIAISTRLNSYGQPVHLRAATNDEIVPVQNARISKAIRTAVLRMVPGDILDDCKNEIQKAIQSENNLDPKAQMRRIIDSFSGIGVDVQQLEQYIGHGVESCNPAEIDNLRTLFQNINSGETNFFAELDTVLEQRETTENEPSTIDKLTAKHGKKKGNDDEPSKN